MNFVYKTSRLTPFLLVVAFVLFFTWGILQRQIVPLQPSVTPTATPEVEFVLNYPSKTFWGNYVTASVEAPPGTDCKLIYMSPVGVMHEIETTANDSGICEGRWKIEKAEGKGTGRLNFTIDGRSETHFIEVRSSF